VISPISNSRFTITVGLGGFTHGHAHHGQGHVTRVASRQTRTMHDAIESRSESESHVSRALSRSRGRPATNEGSNSKRARRGRAATYVAARRSLRRDYVARERASRLACPVSPLPLYLRGAAARACVRYSTLSVYSCILVPTSYAHSYADTHSHMHLQPALFYRVPLLPSARVPSASPGVAPRKRTRLSPHVCDCRADST
jgi:hypothetical protein